MSLNQRPLSSAFVQQALLRPTRSNLPDLTRFHGIIAKNMRRNKLQNMADTMCQTFCGWRLVGSKPNLVKLGSGILEIDAISGKCLFQRRNIDQLTIASELCASMQHYLAATKTPIATLTGARLIAKLSFSVVPWNETTRETFYAAGRIVRTREMNRCFMECQSHIATNEASYRSELAEVQEWPLGWPVDTSTTPD